MADNIMQAKQNSEKGHDIMISLYN